MAESWYSLGEALLQIFIGYGLVCIGLLILLFIVFWNSGGDGFGV